MVMSFVRLKKGWNIAHIHLPLKMEQWEHQVGQRREMECRGGGGEILLQYSCAKTTNGKRPVRLSVTSAQAAATTMQFNTSAGTSTSTGCIGLLYILGAQGGYKPQQ
jgi:hypothetical protein